MIITFLSRLWFVYVHSSWDCVNSQITSKWLFRLTCLCGCRRDFCTHSSVAQILACVSGCKGLRSCLQQKVLLAELWADYNLYTLHWKDRYVLAELPLPVPNALHLKVHFGKNIWYTHFLLALTTLPSPVPQGHPEAYCETSTRSSGSNSCNSPFSSPPCFSHSSTFTFLL